jgi:hypothetical protein
MAQLNDELRLPQICMPGSHDAGMYHTSSSQKILPTISGIAGKVDSLVYTQGRDMRGQLEGGIRYFDLRPECVDFDKATFVAHHTFPLGDDMRNILQAASDFIGSNSSEVLLLEFSHFNKFGEDDSRKAKTAEKFVQLCTSCIKPEQLLNKANPTHLPLSDLRGKILLIVDNDQVYKYASQKGIVGFFKNQSDIHVYDQYANTRFYEEMLVNQMCKFGKFGSTSYSDKLFVLNWTLTPNTTNILPTTTGVDGYANEINPRLSGYGQARDFLFQPNAHGRIVNVINGDYWDNIGEEIVRTCLEVMGNRGNRQSNRIQLKSEKTGSLLSTGGIPQEALNNTDDQTPAIGAAVKIQADKNPKGNESVWLKRYVRDNIYRLQNAATGLYLRAATDSWYTDTFSFFGLTGKDNNLVSSVEESSDDNLLWHFEHLGDNSYHIVSYRRKKDGEKEDRLDSNGHALYLHKPNNDGYQTWKEIAV